MTDSHDSSKRMTIPELRQQLSRWERGNRPTDKTIASTGCRGLDELFPDHGLSPGTLVECVGRGSASGAGTLALLLVRQLVSGDVPWVAVDPGRQLYPVALDALGLKSSLTVVRPRLERDTLWACEEIAKCPAVKAVWARVGPLSTTAFRRLRLAVERSGVVGILVRSSQALAQPSWASVRLVVTPRPSPGRSPRLRTEVASSQGRISRSVADVEIDFRRGTFHDVVEARPSDRVSLVS